MSKPLVYTENSRDDVTLLPIYANANPELKTPINMTQIELEKYVNDYNKLFGTSHKLGNVTMKINDMKKYKNRLYDKEYNRHGELQHVENFCLNSTYDTEMLNCPTKKEGSLRLISYNVHSSIQTCEVYETNKTGYFQNSVSEKNTNNTLNIIKFLKDIDVDVMCFQEYSPISTQNEKAYRLKNFMNLYNQNDTSKNGKIQSYASTFLDGANKEIKYLQNFLGNIIMSKTKLSECGSFNTFSKHNFGQMRGHVYSKINYAGNDIYVFCVHPIAEGNPFIQYNYDTSENNKKIPLDKIPLDIDSRTKDNKDHIEGIVEYIVNVLHLNPRNIPIIVAGDFNTDKIEHMKIFEDNYFVNSKNIYNDTDEYKFTGYHEAYIDNVFVSHGFMNLYQINFSNVLNIGFSDHYPILLEIQKKDNKYVQQFTSFSRARGDLFAPLITTDLNTFINTGVKSHFIDYQKFLKTYGYHNAIITIPHGTYLIHSTSAIAFPNWERKPFELQEHLHPETNLWTKSTVLAHNPIESFSGYYGHLDEISMKRFVIYRVKRDLPMINLYNFNDDSHNLQTRHLARMDFYKNLFQYLKKNTDLPLSFYPLELGFVHKPLVIGSRNIALDPKRSYNSSNNYVGMDIVVYSVDYTWLSAPKLFTGKIKSYDNLMNIVTIEQEIGNNIDTTKKYFYAIIGDDKNYDSITEQNNFPIRREIAVWITSMYIIQALSTLFLSNYLNDDGKYNRQIPFGTIVCDMIQSDDMVSKNAFGSRNTYIYGDEKIDGIELQIMMFNYFTEYAGTYYNGKFYTKDEWEVAYKPILNTIDENTKSGKYHKINFRESNMQPSQIEQQRFAIKLMVDYYKYIVGLLQHPVYSTKETMENVTSILLQVLPKRSKLLSVNRNHFYTNYIINDLLNHLINVKYTTFINKNYLDSKKMNNINLDVFQLNSANIFIQNDIIRKIFIKYITNKRSYMESQNIKYFNDMILFGLCFLNANNYIDPPLLILLECLKLMVNNKISNDKFKSIINSCSNNIEFSNEMYYDIINKDYNLYISVPTYVTSLTNNPVKIIPIDDQDIKYENIRTYYGGF